MKAVTFFRYSGIAFTGLKLQLGSRFTVPPLLAGAEGRQSILRAMRLWERDTCVRFRQRSFQLQRALGHSAHIVFLGSEAECSAAIGRTARGGPVLVLINAECQGQVSAAELLALGVHEGNLQLNPNVPTVQPM